ARPRAGRARRPRQPVPPGPRARTGHRGAAGAAVVVTDAPSTPPAAATAAAPAPAGAGAPGEPILEVRDLVTHFPVRAGFFRRVIGHVHAVDGVSLTLGRREALGIVGESGCGKTTLGRSILRLVEPTSGEVRYRGE